MTKYTAEECRRIVTEARAISRHLYPEGMVGPHSPRERAPVLMALHCPRDGSLLRACADLCQELAHDEAPRFLRVGERLDAIYICVWCSQCGIREQAINIPPAQLTN